MNNFPAGLVRNFNEPSPVIYRAMDHLIGARAGVTLMVPVTASTGKLDDLVDQCPIPHLEASAILDADYAGAEVLDIGCIVASSRWRRLDHGSSVYAFARQLLDAFLADDGVHAYDQAWRHTQIRLSAGGQPCRVLMGQSGVRLALTPDFLEGFL
ncbi:hypothetical protein [Herminiimonas contaminans]|uniref:Uncharacterized protein n=1 Tax=Herminiimonas contaminans TaxID=1111140 RepID=A0ABS0EQE6_9BURK|nr:hypothetical protein [Herminiimonas contaminans]MBF8176945.1 hypothetical protein [Herminiimonas contaminans]